MAGCPAGGTPASSCRYPAGQRAADCARQRPRVRAPGGPAAARTRRRGRRRCRLHPPPLRPERRPAGAPATPADVRQRGAAPQRTGSPPAGHGHRRPAPPRARCLLAARRPGHPAPRTRPSRAPRAPAAGRRSGQVHRRIRVHRATRTPPLPAWADAAGQMPPGCRSRSAGRSGRFPSATRRARD